MLGVESSNIACSNKVYYMEAGIEDYTNRRQTPDTIVLNPGISPKLKLVRCTSSL